MSHPAAIQIHFPFAGFGDEGIHTVLGGQRHAGGLGRRHGGHVDCAVHIGFIHMGGRDHTQIWLICKIKHKSILNWNLFTGHRMSHFHRAA